MTNSQHEYCFLIDRVNEKFPGFSKILNIIIRNFGEVKVINSLDDIEIDHNIIPLGIVASSEFVDKFSKGNIAFIIDATTLGFESVLRFYIKKKKYFNPELLGALLRYIKYYFLEKKVIGNFKKVIVVSEHDANYLRRKFKCSNISVVSNGVDLPDYSNSVIKSFSYTLGILAYWGTGSVMDVKWFINDYLPRLRRIYPEIQLVTAGYGADEETLNFLHRNGIKHLNGIDNLWDFFNRIDIFITTVRKECGILNKVLDAMAHRKIVVGLEHNMYAFKNLENGFFTYRNLDELVCVIDIIKNDPQLTSIKINNAYRYILENHNWDRNYGFLKTLIDKSLR